MRVLLDTCALVWATRDAARLSPEARALIETPGNDFVVSSISLWEIALKVKRGKLALGLPMQEYVGRLSRLENVEILDVTPPVWLRNVALDWAHRDPADRTIVATAELEDLAIVTRDERILRFYARTVTA
ncbi:MAG: type II toxin-antitoxin system VapC family toxin [Lentisphaerae bacterium]|jgi:PIN domain nuclease of toxin-antitoxin system|nr:type II toxin-antitoxin system VapC family toxin [Lentisphaerota bacterium]MBT4818573.1 type II toxin-antitoxin system VapC family toxin [Lentisphaerota bacterium]MBT5609356.1 type II toxin-antitoxin system VapC family toxin [Lentisphaerota bacterium]MBT7057238.1 type II toxin-antitoxin system VapC family toxin [Lentisphaerota bacterium]MBT7843517.1 type II toxin-antitoxin system VapC family toxin [Lentisphaerota bacterium]